LGQGIHVVNHASAGSSSFKKWVGLSNFESSPPPVIVDVAKTAEAGHCKAIYIYN